MAGGGHGDGTDGNEAATDPPDIRTLLVAGTASHVGKSTVVAGLCRALADDGVDVAPFKAQNMSNNAHVALRPPAVREGPPSPDDGERGGGAWGEIGVSQHTQARAARVAPTTDHNPVLLKPRGDGESQVVIDGVAAGHYSAGSYYDDHWERARSAAVAAHRRLAAAHDLVVAEGAGSIAEINLHDRDLANVETARFAGGRPEGSREGAAEPRRDADILLVADIERGGVFASLVGTLELLPDDLRGQVVGAVVNRFRGDRSLLAPGIEAFEDRTGVPVLAVLPHDDPGLPDEDSLSLPARDERAVRGDDGHESAVTVAVVRLPRISNATDVDPLARVPGVRVAFRPPGASLADADAVVLPGTKNAVDDLLACRAAGLGDELPAFDGPVIGICGGYQLLGERLERVAHESTAASGTIEGFGLLPVATRFAPDKRVARAEYRLTPGGPLGDVPAAGGGAGTADGADTVASDAGDGAGPGDRHRAGDGAAPTVTGYEIHAGETRALEPVTRPVGPASAARGNVLGTYCHGLFATAAVRRALLAPLTNGTVTAAGVAGAAGAGESGVGAEAPTDPLDAAAALVREAGLVDAVR